MARVPALPATRTTLGDRGHPAHAVAAAGLADDEVERVGDLLAGTAACGRPRSAIRASVERMRAELPLRDATIVLSSATRGCDHPKPSGCDGYTSETTRC